MMQTRDALCLYWSDLSCIVHKCNCKCLFHTADIEICAQTSVLIVSLAVNTTLSSTSSVGSGERERELSATVDATGNHLQPADDDDDREKRSRSPSRSSHHSGYSDDGGDDRSRASHSVRFAAVSTD